MKPPKRCLSFAFFTATALAGWLPTGVQAELWTGAASLGVQVRGGSGPLEGARVEIRYRGPGGETGGPAPRATDKDGKVSFAGLSEGVWSLEVSHPDHLSFVATLSVRRGKKAEATTSFLEASGEGRIPLRIRFFKAGQRELGSPLEMPRTAREDLPPKPDRAPPAAEPRTAAPTPPASAAAAPPAPATEEEPPAEGPSPTPAADESELPSPRDPEPTPPPEPTPTEVAEPLPQTPPTEEPPSASAETADTGDAAAPSPTRPSEVPEPPEPTAPSSAPSSEAPTSSPEAALPESPEPQGSASESSLPQPETEPAPEEGPLPSPPAAPMKPPSESTPQPESAPVPPVEPAPMDHVEAQPAEEPAGAPETDAEPEAPEIPPSAPEEPSAPETSAAPSVPPIDEPSAELPPLPRSDGSLRSFRQRTCFECKPGEFAVGAAQEVAPARDGAGCPAGALDAGEAAARGLAAALGERLAEFAGDVLDEAVLARLEADERSLLESDLLAAGSSCRLFVLALPAGSRMSGFRFEALADGRGGDCLGDQPCPVGDSRWLSSPRLERGAGATLLWTVFENRAPEGRLARLVAYFTPPPGWRP